MNETDTQRKSRPDSIKKLMEELPVRAKITGFTLVLLLIYRVFIDYRHYSFYKILQQNLDLQFIIYSISHVVVSFLWFITFYKFLKMDRRFPLYFRITAFISFFIPISVRLFNYGDLNIKISWLSPYNVFLIYLVIVVLSFTLLRKNDFKTNFNNYKSEL